MRCFLILFFLNSFHLYSQDYYVSSVSQILAGELSSTTDVAVNSLSEKFMAGIFRDQMEVDGVVLGSENMYSVFLVKFNEEGGMEWLKVISEQTSDILLRYTNNLLVRVDYSDNVYVSFSTTNNHTINQIESVSSGDQRISHILKYDSNGAFLGDIGLDSDCSNWLSDLYFDEDLMMHALLHFEPLDSICSCTLGSDTLIIDRAFSLLAVKPVEQDYIYLNKCQDYLDQFKVYDDSYLITGYKIGSCSSPTEFDSYNFYHQSSYNECAFLCGLERIGPVKWSYTLGQYSSGSVRISDAVELSNGNVVASVNTHTLSFSGWGGSVNQSSYFIGFDDEQNLLWDRVINTQGDLYFRDVMTDEFDNFYLSGYYSGVLNLEVDTVESVGSDLFLAAFNADGVEYNLNVFSENGGESMQSMYRDPNGDFYMVCHISGDSILNQELVDDYDYARRTLLVKLLESDLALGNHHAKSNLRVFPNPTMSQVEISSDKYITKVETFDLYGGKLSLELLPANTNSLRFQLTASNSNFIFIKTTFEDGETSVRKLVLYK